MNSLQMCPCERVIIYFVGLTTWDMNLNHRKKKIVLQTETIEAKYECKISIKISLKMSKTKLLNLFYAALETIFFRFSNLYYRPVTDLYESLNRKHHLIISSGTTWKQVWLFSFIQLTLLFVTQYVSVFQRILETLHRPWSD